VCRRPATSFLWFTSPLSTFKNIIWKKSKWYLVGVLLVICAFIFVLLFLWSLPVSRLVCCLSSFTFARCRSMLQGAVLSRLFH
jgi:hypothetical protein